MMKKVAIVAPAVAGAVVLGLAAPALAAWSTTASGPSKAGARTLATPAPSTQSCTKSGSSNTIVTAWAAVTGAATYKVERATGSPAGAFSQVQLGSALTYSRTEALAANGTFHYRVTALVGTNWDSASGTNTQSVNNGGNCT